MNRRLAAELRRDFGSLHVVLRPDGQARLGATNAKVALVSVQMMRAFDYDDSTTAAQVKSRADLWVDRFLHSAAEPFRSVAMIRAEFQQRRIYAAEVPVGGVEPVVTVGSPSTWSSETAEAASDLFTLLANLRTWPEAAAQIERDRASMRLGPLGSQ